MAQPTYQFSVDVSQDGATLYLNDETGDYSVDNPGGYGAPNTARSDLALIVIAKYKATAADSSITVSGYDPESVTQWIMPGLTLDGHYEMKVYQVAKSGTEGAPTTNLFRWDFATNLLERYNGSGWVTSPATAGVYTELETYDAPHTTVDYPLLVKLWRALNNLNKLNILGSKTNPRTTIREAVYDTQIMIDGVIAMFAEGNYSQAQEAVEKYDSRATTILSWT